MAWLEFKGGTYRIGFQFGGGKHHFQLKTANRKAAEATLGRFESNYHLIEQGVNEVPPAGADLGSYIVSGGKHGNRPSQIERVAPKTLANLLDSYLSDYPKGAKEASTLKTERIHVAHLRHYFDTNLLADVTTRDVQVILVQ